MPHHTLHGAKPGANTPIKKAAGGDETSTATTQINSKIIVARAIFVRAASCFSIDHGIGADTLLMAALLAVYAAWSVLA